MTLMCDSLFLGLKCKLLHYFVVKSVAETHLYDVKSVQSPHIYVVKNVVIHT